MVVLCPVSCILFYMQTTILLWFQAFIFHHAISTKSSFLIHFLLQKDVICHLKLAYIIIKFQPFVMYYVLPRRSL